MDRVFMIFPVTQLSKIDFSQVLETSSETVRKSVDGTKTFVKWEGESEPACLSSVTGKSGPHTYEEMIAILATEEWTAPVDMNGV
jgi:hypothetical protein